MPRSHGWPVFEFKSILLKNSCFFSTVATTTVLFSLFNHLNYVDVCLSLDYKLLKGKDHVFQNATYAMLFNNYLLNANVNKCRSMFNFYRPTEQYVCKEHDYAFIN